LAAYWPRIGRVLAAYWPRIGRALRQTNCAGSDGQHCGLQPALGRPSCRPAHIDVPRGANRIGRLYHTPHNAALLWRPPQLLDFLRERLGLVGARAGAPAVAELTLRTRLNATIDFAKWCFHPPLPCCSPFRHPTLGTHTHTHTHTHSLNVGYAIRPTSRILPVPFDGAGCRSRRWLDLPASCLAARRCTRCPCPASGFFFVALQGVPRGWPGVPDTARRHRCAGVDRRRWVRAVGRAKCCRLVVKSLQISMLAVLNATLCFCHGGQIC
jgi:hypothetical protein